MLSDICVNQLRLATPPPGDSDDVSPRSGTADDVVRYTPGHAHFARGILAPPPLSPARCNQWLLWQCANDSSWRKGP